MTAATTGRSSARRTQSERRADAEGRLIAAAAAIASEEGPSAVTLAKVGARAGYSRGLVAHHFGSKAALMQRVADQVSDEFRTAVFERYSADAPLLDSLRMLLGVYFDIIADLPELNRARLALVADAVAHPGSDYRDVVLHADREFRSALRRAIDGAAGELPEGFDAETFSVLLVGALRGIAFESMLDPDVDLERARSELDALLTARLTPPTDSSSFST